MKYLLNFLHFNMVRFTTFLGLFEAHDNTNLKTYPLYQFELEETSSFSD